MNFVSNKAKPSVLPGLLESGWLMAKLFLKVAVGKKHLGWLLMVLLAPVGLTVYLRVFRGGSGEVLFEEIMVNAYLQFLCLGVSLFWGVSAIRDEIEDKTIVYLFSRPIRRGVIFGGKIVSVILFSFAILSVGVGLSYLVATVPEGFAYCTSKLYFLVKALGVIWLACMVYTSLFGLAGVLFRKPMLLAMLFAVGWEGFVSNLSGRFPMLTIMYYLKSLLGLGPDTEGIIAVLMPALEPAGHAESLAVILVGTLVFFFGCVYLGARKEIRV